jgi:glutamyl-tRNA synthetase
MVRTRFAPSPTGLLHLGGARTALFSWLYARRHGGTFILRIEDTDRERSTDAAVQVILEGMSWLGLDYDAGPFYQTQRFDRYAHYVAKLVAEGQAYPCYCSKETLEQMRTEQETRKEKPRYDGRCRHRTDTPPVGVSPVIRFANPTAGVVVVDDQIHGKVTFANQELDDLIIARSDGTPTYNFTVVVDDFEMEITHVIRGDDHLNNTPRQINLLKALGATVPTYAHVPMILGADGAKLSKRHGAVSVLEYRDQGILPVAMLNALARMGWAHGDQEIFTLEEMVQAFDLSSVNKSAARFDPDKLLWLNQQHLMRGDPLTIAPQLGVHCAALGLDVTQGPDLAAVVVAQRERCKTLVEMAERSRFWYQDVSYDPKAAAKQLNADTAPLLRLLAAEFATLADWRAENLNTLLHACAAAQQLNLGKLAQPLRVAVSGGTVSPPIDVTLALLGRERTLTRLETALAWIATAQR